MMRAFIALAVLLAVAIASKASGPRGGDLRAARMTSEIPVAKKTPSAPDTGKAHDSDDLDEGPLGEGETEVESTPSDPIQLEVVKLMIRTKPNASGGPDAPDERSVREMSVHNIVTALHRILVLDDERELAAMTKRAVLYLDAHSTFLDGTNILTPQEFFAHLLEFVPSVVEPPGQPIEKICDRLVSLISSVDAQARTSRSSRQRTSVRTCYAS